MKLPFQLYEEAGAGGAGGGGGSGAGSAGGAGEGTRGSSAGASAGSGNGSLLSGSGTKGGAGESNGAAGAGGTGEATKGGQSSTPDPFFVGLWDTTGKINKAAFDRLPENLKPYKDTFGKYETAEQFFHGVANLAQLAGKKGLAPLPADAPESAKAERNALMRQINGVPEKPEGYGLKKPDGMPDTLWDQGYVDSVAAVLHKHNASPDLVRELMAADIQHSQQYTSQQQAQVADRIKQEQTSLRDAFGGEYDKKIDLAVRAARTLGLDPNDAAVFGNHKVVVAFAKMAEMVSEDRMVSGDTGGGGFGKGDREKARDIINNPQNPLNKAYHDPTDPRHQAAVEQVSAFNKAAVARKRTA